MTKMTWEKLLSPLRTDPNQKAGTSRRGRPFHDVDYDRILFSAPFRRLANKTQVHPLYEHDHVHHRMIHSVETSTVGHTLGYEVGLRLLEAGELSQEQVAPLAGVVRAACLAHDIGNPPFGHSGEAAIGEWFSRRFRETEGCEDRFWDRISRDQQLEFEAFEGNAQGFRIVTRTEMYHPDIYPGRCGMELSAAVLGAFMKYPVTAQTQRDVKTASLAADKQPYKGVEKFGVFDSERESLDAVADRCGLLALEEAGHRYWCRHPLVFLVEAADDICYNVVDVEDAYAAGDLRFEEVRDALSAVAGPLTGFTAVADYPERLFSNMRARAIGKAVQASVDAFLANYEAIVQGRFSQGLVGVSEVAEGYGELRRLSRERIFTSGRKTELEILGRNLLHTNLTHIADAAQELARFDYDVVRFQREGGYAARLLTQIPFDFVGIHDAYSTLHAVTDLVSGMTDRHAVRVARMVQGT